MVEGFCVLGGMHRPCMLAAEFNQVLRVNMPVRIRYEIANSMSMLMPCTRASVDVAAPQWRHLTTYSDDSHFVGVLTMMIGLSYLIEVVTIIKPGLSTDRCGLDQCIGLRCILVGCIALFEEKLNSALSLQICY